MIVVDFNGNNEGSAHDSVDHHGGYDFSTKNKNGEETPKFNSAMKMIVNKFIFKKWKSVLNANLEKLGVKN